MAKIPGLMRRGGSFVYRASVPKDLHEVYGSQRQIWRTLEASTESEAKREAHKMALAFMDEFNAKRAEITASNGTTSPAPMKAKRYSITTLARLHASNVLDREEARGESLFNLYLDDPREFKRRVYSVVECAKLLDNHFTANEIHGFEGWIDHLYDGDADRVVAFIERKRIQGRIAQIKRWKAVKDFREFSSLVDTLAPDIAEDQRRPLIRAFMESEIAALSPLAEQEAPAPSPTAPVTESLPQTIAQIAPNTPAPVITGLPLLEDVKRPYLDTKRDSGKSAGYIDDQFKAIDDFISIVGDKPINAYVKADVRDYLSVIQLIPPNSRKQQRYLTISLREIAERAKKDKASRPDIATVHRKFDAVAGLFRWLNQNYDEVQGNPFDGMRPQERKNARDERHPFTMEELGKIFTSPPFSGAQSAARWMTPGKLILKASGLFWLPFIALYSGMRLGEIMQMTKADIKTEDGITYFDVNTEGDKKLKTAASHRRIPVHPTLEKAGLLKYVANLAKPESRLIHDIPLSNRYGDMAGRGSRKMAELLIKSGAKTEKNSFHSFRHNFEDGCRDAVIDHGVMSALQGHVMGGMADRYGHGKYALPILKEAIDRIEYKGFTPPAWS